jgi:hypothetical protein
LIAAFESLIILIANFKFNTMAKYHQGILGGFTGKVGDVVGYQRNGVDVIRSLPAKHKYKPTIRQLEQRLKFSILSAFTKLMSTVFNGTFRNAGKISRGNRPFAYNYCNAICGSYPDFRIDYSEVRLAYGSLITPGCVVITAGIDSEVVFNWSDHTNNDCGAGDKAVLICFCPDLNEVIYSIGPATRRDGTALLKVPAFTGKEVHVWITFISGSRVATSCYCGSVTIQDPHRRIAGC